MPSRPTRDRTKKPPLFNARGSKPGRFGPLEWALLGGVALIWGSAFLLTEIALDAMDPSTITWARITLGFAVLTTLPQARKPIDRRDYPLVALLGLTWIGAPFLLFASAQQHIDSALAGMLNGMVPIFGASIAMLLTRTLPRLPHAVGITLGLIGAVSISLPAARGAAAGAWGIGLIVVANILYGLSHNLVIPLQQRYGAPAVMMRAIGFAAAVTAPFGLAGLTASRRSIASITAVILLGIIHTGLAYVIMAALVGRVGATRGGVAIYLIPVVAVALGVLFRSEVVFPIQLAGTAVVVFGAWLTSRREA